MKKETLEMMIDVTRRHTMVLAEGLADDAERLAEKLARGQGQMLFEGGLVTWADNIQRNLTKIQVLEDLLRRMEEE